MRLSRIRGFRWLYLFVSVYVCNIPPVCIGIVRLHIRTRIYIYIYIYTSAYISNLPTAVQTLWGGSPHRGRIAAPTVPYDLPLVRLMYTNTRGMKYRTGTSTYCLPACMQGGRQEGRHPERISNESQTNNEKIPNAYRLKMRAPVSTCSAVQYRTTYPWYDWPGRQAFRTNPELIAN